MLVVIDEFLDTAEVKHFRQTLETAQWSDGSRSAGGINALAKNNQQVDPDCTRGRDLGEILLRKMGTHNTVVSAALPHNIFPPVFNSFTQGETYGAHVDAAIMRIPGTAHVLRSDMSMTVFLSEPDEYDGGELVIEDQFGAQEVKLAAGDAVLYPSSSLHAVTPVTRGKRVAAITWLQSMIAESDARTLLFELDSAIQGLTNSGAQYDEVLRLTSVYHNLIRRFAQV